MLYNKNDMKEIIILLAAAVGLFAVLAFAILNMALVPIPSCKPTDPAPKALECVKR